ncbi:hypothetical protein D9M69_552370 [compost metagenome]
MLKTPLSSKYISLVPKCDLSHRPSILANASTFVFCISEARDEIIFLSNLTTPRETISEIAIIPAIIGPIAM